jgi:hypothetical protein
MSRASFKIKSTKIHWDLGRQIKKKRATCLPRGASKEKQKGNKDQKQIQAKIDRPTSFFFVFGWLEALSIDRRHAHGLWTWRRMWDVVTCSWLRGLRFVRASSLWWPLCVVSLRNILFCGRFLFLFYFNRKIN